MTILERIKAVDLSDETSEIDQIDARLKELETAVSRGHDRISAIGKTIADLREARESGQEAADALLAREDVLLAMPQAVQLNSERMSIQAGLRKLANEQNELERRRSEVKAAARAKLYPAIDAAAARIKKESQATIRTLAQHFADARALAWAFDAPSALKIDVSLAEAVGSLYRDLPPKISPSDEIAAAIHQNPYRKWTGGTLVGEVAVQ